MNKTRPTSRNKDHRKNYLRSRARELAMSGRFERWQGIEFELTFVEGLPEARTLLAGRSIRKRLDLLCRQARTVDETGTVHGTNAIDATGAPDTLAPQHGGNLSVDLA
jgi:hypothetical protein